MPGSYPCSAIVTGVALLVYVWVTLKVGQARVRFGVRAPSIDGPADFQRAFRVQQNTLEQIVLFVPALWLFAAAWGDAWAAAIGAAWPVGRVLYAATYYQAAERRGPGFAVAFIAAVILLLGGLVGAVSAAF